MKHSFPTALSAGLFLASIALLGAQAQTRPAREVNRDELRACMNSESSLATRRQAVESRGKQNSTEFDAIRAEAAELTEEKKRIEERNTSRDRFDRRVNTHNTRVQAAQALGESYRTDLAALNKDLSTHHDQCGVISFKPEDREAIQKERGPAKN